MIRISLPRNDVDRLEQVFGATPEAKPRHRVQIVLMAHRGRRHPDIAADTGTTSRSVPRWSNAYLDRGLDGLTPRKAKGAEPKLTPDLAPLLRQGVIDGPAKQGLDRANRTYAGLADHLYKTPGVRVRKSAPQAFGASHGIRPYRPAYRFLRGDPAKQATAREESGALKKGAAAGGLVLPSQDEARSPMAPTPTAAPGVKGRRPVVGTWDGRHLLDVFGVVNLAHAAVHATLLDSPKDATKRTGKSKARRLQEGFAAHLRHVGRMYPAGASPRVVIRMDNAPWHAGEPVRAAPAANPHLELKRRPSYRPRLNPIERFWKLLRRRATHNRLFDTSADLRRSIRRSRSYFQTVRDRVKTLLDRRARKRTASAGP